MRGLVAAAVLLALVAGLPWALSRFVGWPLPDHLPSWDEVQAVLLGPMHAGFLLDFLACLCWITWAAFTADVVRCAVDVVHGARWPDLLAAGPMHAPAAILVGAIMLSILGNRATAPPPTSAQPVALGAGSGVVATAPAWPSAVDGAAVAVRRAGVVTQEGGPAALSSSSRPTTEIVRHPDPATGVHDSLWRVSERALGAGARWVEIFELNKGMPQPNGRAFTNPSLVFPGDVLVLPQGTKPIEVAPPSTPEQPVPPPPATTTPPATTSTPTTTVVPSSPATATPPTRHAPPAAGEAAPPASREPAISWGSDLYLGLGLAAAVSAALMIARRRYRRRYQPGSGRRDDLPVAPVVYQLRLAHLRAEHDDDLDLDLDLDMNEHAAPLDRPQRSLVIGAADPANTRSCPASSIAPGLGVRDGREIALDLADARGLGLVGAGASSAARALVLASLTPPIDNLATSAGATIVVPAGDLPLLLGRIAAHPRLPRALRVVAGLDEALDELEAETLLRAREEHPGSWPTVVLVARTPEHNSQRLQAVLDNGSVFGIVGVLLGQWLAGVTAYVREDGTISATSPGLGEALRETRMFRVGGDDTAQLLALLHRAQPEPSPVEEELASTSGPQILHTAPGNDNDVLDGDRSHAGGGRGEAAAPTAVDQADTELEVTAAGGPAEPSDTELEIVEPRPIPTPGARLRPVAGQQPPASPIDEEQDVASQRAGELDTIGTAEAGEVGSTTAPIRITVLGAPRVYWRPEPGDGEQEITGAFQPRLRELLVFLAVHPDGATREALVAALWADSAPEKTTNAMNTSLSRLRRALGKATEGALAEIAVVGDGRYRLDPALVDVDYWRFDRAVTARRAAPSERARIDAYRVVVNAYTGPLGDGMSAEWIESAREAIRRDAIDAVAELARALVDSDPEQTLNLLEIARAFDPHNELLYRDIMRLQERLGRLDAIPRTLTLLTTRLAEVDDRPTPQALGLAARLRQRHDRQAAASLDPGTQAVRRDQDGRDRSAAS
ncbi:transcriptional regulator [Lentzea sp. NPDC051213]|uniref:transcriptional regulator n=1 Tax=Lentzea sp. NPDC051213 TaxID=3364126 RepID=UPI0037980211